ncbi:hypothetical protein SLE2022_014780 [Rubroshorea leprosula]
MNKIVGSDRSRYIIGTGPRAFLQFCDILEREGGLQPTRRATIEEQVAKTLYILAKNAKNRSIQFWFRRSGETTSRHFHSVLRAIIAVEEKFIKQPDGSQIPVEIMSSSRFYPYFKDCVGAIDGTHIRVKVSPLDAPKYRGRKEYPTQNVLAACTFDLKFTYVLTGWEGTASDSRIIKDALKREDKLIIPEGKFYLVDAGFMLKSGLITPYRGVRYHLKEYSNNPPQNAKELFNLRHAALRNAIERAFGVLKRRFEILRGGTESFYGVRTQNLIILACCIIHNFLMGVDPDEELIAEVDMELRNQENLQQTRTSREEEEDASRGEMLRDVIAADMWHNYKNC